ncbi:Multidrug resistance protein 3 [compost metagenome]
MTREQKLTLIGIFMAMFLAALDQTIVSTAMPRIVTELGGTSLYAWVATTYLLTSTVSGPVFGRLTETVVSKWALLAAVVVFLLGSALCGAAPNMEALVAFRGIQGLGGGALFAVVLTVFALMFPPRERGKLQGLFGAIFGISSILGPWLGGFITDHISWRWVFYINMPVGAIALYFIIRHMPAIEPPSRQRFDVLGAVSLAVWTVPLMLIISWGGHTYAWASVQILGLAALTLAGLGLFIWAERRSDAPLFDLGLFKLPTFTWASAAAFFFGGAFMGAIIFLPLYLVQVKGISSTYSGLSMTPLSFGMMAGSITAGRLASKTGRYKYLMIISAVWLLGCVTALHFIMTAETPLWQIVTLMVLIGLGFGPSMPLYPLAVQNAVERDRIGTASSANMFFRQVGSTMGVALLGSVLVTTLQTEMPKHLPAGGANAAFKMQGEGQMQDTGAIEAKIKQQFDGLYADMEGAIKGDQAAYEKVMANPMVPAERKAMMQPGGIPAALKARFGEPKTPAEQARLDGAIAQAEGQALEGLRKGLDEAAAQLVAKLKEGFNAGITEAMRQIYLYVAILVLLSLFAIFLLPNAELKHHGAPGGKPGEAPTGMPAGH